MTPVLYILYNADASLTGKITYGYRKLTAPKDKPACAACDITHGGLHLDETAEWKKVKEDIAKGQQLELKQLHRDQMDAPIKSFAEANKLRYPMVILGEGSSDFKLVLNSDELAACNGNAQIFVQKLQERGAFTASATASV